MSNNSLADSFVKDFLEDLKLSSEQNRVIQEWISDVLSTLDIELLEALFRNIEVEYITPSTIITVANMTKPCKNVCNERAHFISRSNEFLAKINWPFKIK